MSSDIKDMEKKTYNFLNDKGENKSLSKIFFYIVKNIDELLKIADKNFNGLQDDDNDD